jgi:hypothetical protein
MAKRKSKQTLALLEKFTRELSDAMEYIPTDQEQERIFRDSVTQFDHGLWPRLPDLDRQLQKALTSGDKDAAISACVQCIAGLAKQIAVLCAAIKSERGMIERECKRRHAQGKAQTKAAAERQEERRELCRKLKLENPEIKQTTLAKRCGVTPRQLRRDLENADMA